MDGLDLLDRYISEEKLNADIHITSEIAPLFSMLKLKSNLILCKKHSAIDFPVDIILWQLNDNVDKVCETIRLALMIQQTNQEYFKILDYISNQLTNINENDLLIKNLMLLNAVFSVVEMNDNRFALTENIRNAICNVLQTDSTSIRNFMCTYILPKYLFVNNTDTEYVLKIIWHKTLISENLDILCTIPQFFIVSEAHDFIRYSLVNDLKFWILLQKCLVNIDSQVQKQALYVLKRAIHSLRAKESFEQNLEFLCWNSNNKKNILNAWDNLIMLFEIFSQKQLHLIEPSYYLLPSIDILHASWILCIHCVLLSHSNSAVSEYAILNVFKSTWHYEIEVFKRLIPYLLPAVNKTEFVQKPELWRAFSEFCNTLEQQKLILLIEHSSTIIWIPPVCYQFYKSFCCNLCYKIEIPFDVIEKILKNIKNLTHKIVRGACKTLIVNFTKQNVLHEKQLNLADYFTINWILYKDCCLLESNYDVYIPELKAKIVSWINIPHVDSKEMRIILKLIEIISFEEDYFEEYILKPFVERKFVIEVSDRLVKLLCLKNKLNHVIDYIRYRLLNLTSHNKVYEVDSKEIFTLQGININLLSKDCVDVLFNEHSNIYQQEFAFEIIALLLNKLILLKEDIINIRICWKKKVLSNINRLNSKICLSFLDIYCFKNFKGNELDFPFDRETEQILIFEKLLETQTDEVAPKIFKHLKFIIINAKENVEKVYHFVDVCLRKLTELKGTDTFKDAAEIFIRSVFFNNEHHYNHYITEKNITIALKLLDLARSCDDVAYSLVQHFYNLTSCNRLPILLFHSTVVELLLFGGIFKKEQRAEYHVCQMISKDLTEAAMKMNPNYRRVAIRIQAVNIIHKGLTNCTASQSKSELTDVFTSLLIDKYRLYFNKRYFADSNIHLQKLRILQALLVVHNYISSQKGVLIELLMDSLCTESHQLSVKFLIQWLLIRLLVDNKQGFEVITSKMKSTSKVHSSSIIAFIPILYHIALLNNEEVLWLKLYKTMLSWTMGPHFNLRLYAQIGLQKIYQTAIKFNFKNLIQKFEVVSACISEALNSTEREIDPVDQHFFDIFNPTEHYCLQVIYFNIPKMTNVAPHEYENVLWIKEFSTHPELHEVYKSIEKSKPKVCDFNPVRSIFQKKIEPYVDDLLQNERQTGELIVIASLIDKSPNLGGISRTCEIFGIKQLIVNNINVIHDREFQSVSMTSESWINIAEAKVNNLRLFMLELKKKGYSIVGCEQTSNSSKLNTFQFPKNSALLLGSEKEGIPPNLLSLVDVCVEIPQFGVVRSLNVHVAAATFMWEYVKQHMVLTSYKL